MSLMILNAGVLFLAFELRHASVHNEQFFLHGHGYML